jgi:hypothetical protein
VDNLHIVSARWCTYGCSHTRLRRKETHLVQALEHRLEHARPFGAVAGQLRGRGRGEDGTHTSMEPSRAASSSICSLDNMLPSMEHPAQVRAAQRLGKLGCLASCTYDGVWFQVEIVQDHRVRVGVVAICLNMRKSTIQTCMSGIYHLQ